MSEQPKPLPAKKPPLTAFERAVLYLKKVSGASEGARNKTLHDLGFTLLTRFKLTEAEHKELMQSWNSTCSPPLPDREAEATIQSAWKGAHKRNVVGSKAERPLPGRSAPSPLSPPLAGGELGTDGAGAQVVAKAEEGGPDYDEFGNPIEGSEDGAGDDVLAAEDAARVRYLDDELPNRILPSIIPKTGTERDGAAQALFEKLAWALSGASAVTRDRIKEYVTRDLKLSKSAYNDALKEGIRARESKTGELNEQFLDWGGLADRFLEAVASGEQRLV